MVIILDLWILVHFDILLIGDAYQCLVSQTDFNYHLINFCLVIILGFLKDSALDINFAILRFTGYNCICLQVCFLFFLYA